MEPAYRYAAELLRWIDGDTFEARVDLGFRVRIAERFRLTGYNAPELHGEDAPLGRLAFQRAAELVPVGSRCVLTSERGDSFGRWLATVWPQDGGPSLVDRLIREGFGVAWDGRGGAPAPWRAWPVYPNPVAG